MSLNRHDVPQAFWSDDAMYTATNELDVPEIRDWCREEFADGRVIVSYYVRYPGHRHWSYVELERPAGSDRWHA